MQKFFQLLKNDRTYKLTWNSMLVMLMISTFMIGLVATGLIPIAMMGGYFVCLFTCIVASACTAIFYYVLRILRSPQKAKHVAYYKRGNK